MFGMLNNVLRNLLSRPATRLYPFTKRPTFKNTRGQLGTINIETCTFCTLCARRCPSNAIVVDRAAKTWELDRYRCIVCAACVEVCPKDCLSMDEQHAAPVLKQTKSKHMQPPKPTAAAPAN
jgi:formate hydrogenlyase subunit 6/NADH:ubiquinone oxidoreductase subunit I